MKEIAILGTGRVGSALANALTRAGHKVTLGSRDPGAAKAKWQEVDLRFATIEQAAQLAQVVFNAAPGADSLTLLTPLASALAGKVLVDVANATTRNPDGSPGTLLYPQDSLAERLQQALPEVSVVKTLNTLLSPVMENPTVLKGTATVFLSGNSEQAKQEVRALLQSTGWPEAAILDLGGIQSARGTEALMAIVPFLIKSQGFRPFALSATY